MAFKTVLFIFSLTLLAANAESSSIGSLFRTSQWATQRAAGSENGTILSSIWESLSSVEWDNADEVKSVLLNLLSSLKSASSTEEDTTTRTRRSIAIDNKIVDVVDPLTELITFDISQFKHRTTRDVAVRKVRDLSFSITSNLNQLIKFILSYYLDKLELYIGDLIVLPAREVLDWLLDWLLPCGVTCTVLA
ncbi:uncharacterized protein LOC130901156 [Diorhabda carinulata]|uniref:uncharacterized protein LOC130901156 n=1 Tax=Diorhabda carinulata TaxID=1163345 RepID=UPI0025A03E4C|nr:uncharacterized protein LOC130901156 [Diorhabda carinulata]